MVILPEAGTCLLLAIRQEQGSASPPFAQEEMVVTTREEYLEAAKTLPDHRTVAQQALVDRGSNMQEVRNADHAAQQHQKVYGS